MRNHLLRRVLDSEKHALGINLLHAVPPLHRQIPYRNRLRDPNARVINHDIQSSVLPHSSLHQHLDLRRLRDIRLHEDRAAAVLDYAVVRGAEGFGRAAGVERARLEVCADEKGAFGGVGKADGAPDAGGGACDYGDFVGEAAGWGWGDVAAEETPHFCAVS